MMTQVYNNLAVDQGIRLILVVGRKFNRATPGIFKFPANLADDPAISRLTLWILAGPIKFWGHHPEAP